MARNLNPSLVDPQSLRRNLRVIAGTLDAEHYRRWVGANSFQLDGATKAVTAALTTPLVDFADGATQNAFATIERPEFWTSGQVRLTLYYVTDTTSAGNFAVRPVIYPRPLGDSIAVNTPGEFAAGTHAIPAGTANQIATWEMPERAPVDAGDVLITLRVRRVGTDASDTAVAVMRLLGAMLTYQPNHSEAA